MTKKIICILLILLMTFSFGVSEAFGHLNICSSVPTVLNSNESANTYYSWANPVSSYLTDTGSGYMRLECDGDFVWNDSGEMIFKNVIFAEYYDYSFNYNSTRKIPIQLEDFGGFFAGKDAYYIAFSQDNLEENDSTEVFRIVKYDFDWNEIGHASLFGANTWKSISGGSLRMTENNGILYIKTCHEMYHDQNGTHHQANLYMTVNEDSMSMINSRYDVSNVGTGYSSHSFNQFIIIDDEGNIVSADHGDGYPRSVVVFRQEYMQSHADSWNVLDIQGETGDNHTGVNVGGLEVSHQKYIVVGSTVKQDENFSNYGTKNIFVGIVYPKTGNTKLLYFTELMEGNRSVGNPQLIKINDDKYLIMWDNFKSNGSGYKATDVSYVYIDSDGNKLSEIGKINAKLSDCQPIYRNGKAYWYVASDKNELRFYSIDENGKLVSRLRGRGVPGITECTVYPSSGGHSKVYVSWDYVEYAKGYYVYRSESKNGKYKKIGTQKGTYMCYLYDNSALKGKTYYYKVKAYKKDYVSAFSKPMKATK